MGAPEEYHRAKSLFLSARGLARGERTRFLEARCAGDAALEAKVRRLLILEEEEPEFLTTPAAETDGPALGAGTRLGRFRIVRVLGEGGMGVVYEALEDEPSRRVALKLIRAGPFSERLRSRFRHEIRILGQLRHPGIAQIYEAGTLELLGDRVPYFAMELVEGRPLLECTRDLDVRERLTLLAQICDAVHHAHQKGVIHRDLKPGNILVEAAPTSEGSSADSGAGTVVPFQVKILDFGVARAVEADTPAPRDRSVHTHTGQLIGTLPYMSPEQAAADPSAMDIRSDVYSIGVIACEMLVGRLPYDVEGKPLPEAARVIGEVEPVRLGSLDRALRGDVETIVAKALRKDPRHRYQSAAELAADIRRHLRDEPIAARPPTAIYHLRKFARRHKTLVIAAGLVLLAMAGATIVSVWQARVATRAQAFAEGEQHRADLSAGAARREASRATLAGAAAAIASADPITATRLLDRAEEASRAWGWRYWHARLDECVALIRPGGPIAGAWISPDAGEVAIVTRDGVVRRGSPWSGALPEVARLADAPARLAVFIDQGRRIVTVGPDRRVLTVLDALDGHRVFRHEPLEAPMGLLEASSDGGLILAGLRRPGLPPGDVVWRFNAWESGDAWTGTRADIAGATGAAVARDGTWMALGTSRVQVWNAAESEPRVLGAFPRSGLRFAITADGALIAAGGMDKAISLWDRATGAIVQTLFGHVGDITALAFDPSGRTLASASGDLTIRLWNVADGRVLATLIGHEAPVDRLQFSADGSTIMSESADESIRLWRRDPYEGASILRAHTSYVYAVACTPDGSRILSGAWDGTVRAWSSADGRPLAAADAGHGIVTALGVAPDGRILASGHKSDGTGRETSIVLWDAASLRPERELPPMEGEISDLIFSRDGSRLYVAHPPAVDELDLSTNPTRRRKLTEGPQPGSLALAPDGRRLACGQRNGAIAIIAVATGAIERRLPGHTSQVRSVAFHPTRPLLASASDDGTARLWDLETGAAAVLRGHADKVYSVAFSPDGRILATGSEDSTIVLWDVESAEEITRLRGHDAYVYSLAFSPDGSMLVSGSGDHTVRVWDTRPVYERWRARETAAPP